MALTQRPKSRRDRKPRLGQPQWEWRRTGESQLEGVRTERSQPNGEQPDREVEGTLQTGLPGVPLAPAATEQAGVGLADLEGVGGARLLASDARTAFLLINYARLRAVARLFGVSPEQANLVTAIALLTLAETVRRKVRAIMDGPAIPSLDDSFLGGAILRELMGGVAGLSKGDNPQTTLLTLAVVSGMAGPTVVKSIRGVRMSSHRVALGFHHRYGYLIDPGHWRERHAQRAARLAAQRT